MYPKAGCDHAAEPIHFSQEQVMHTLKRIGKVSCLVAGVAVVGLMILSIPGCFAIGDGNSYDTNILRFGY